jgi:arylsulfatase A-like enzyme
MPLSRRELLAAAAFAPSRPRPPNIVFLLSDDHHFQCLGANGNPHIKTPNLDRLASRGVLFPHAQISTAQCNPSRGILLSGLETYQSGLLSNGRTAFRPGLGPSVVAQLRTAGYDTALFGKWHISNSPAECGFTKAPLWMQEGSMVYRNPRLRRGLDAKDETVPGHITDLLTDEACRYLDASRDASKPFLLWLAYNAPHSPLYAAPRYFEPYRQPMPPPAHPKTGATYFDWQTYYAVISHLDEAVGRVIDSLDKNGQWDNTLVVFLGDNGFLCGAKGLSGKVHPWEPSVRVPFILSGGLAKKPGAVSYPLAGRTLRSYLDKGAGSIDEGFSVWADGRADALTVNRAVEPYRLVRTRTHKYILWESKREATYDLRRDPLEESPLVDARLRRQLRARLAARMKRTADPAYDWL